MGCFSVGTKRSAIIRQLHRDYWLRAFGDFLTGFGRSMLIPFMLIYLTQAGNFPTWVATLLAAVPQFFQLFSTSWGGLLADYYGRKPVMFLSLLGSGAILILMAGENYRLVYLGYVLFLIISNFYRPAAMAMITEVVPVELHRQAFSILRMLANLGFALGPLIGASLFFSHRGLVIIGTGSAYLLVACTVFFMHETGSVLKIEGSLWSKSGNPLATFSLLKRDVRLRWAVISGVLFLMVQLQMFSSFTVIVNDTFQDNGRMLSYLLMINTAGVMFAQYFITNITRFLNFYRLFFLAIVFSTLGWGMLIAPIGIMRFYILLILTTLAEMLFAAGYNPHVASLAQNGEVARYMSFTQTSNILGQMVGPTIGALGYDYAGSMGYVFVLWILSFLTLLSLQILKRHNSRPYFPTC